MNFTIQYFREKFTAIPETAIGEGGRNKNCALFHCAVSDNEIEYEMTEEANALAEVFLPLYPINYRSVQPGIVWQINDAVLPHEMNDINLELQKLTPKRRILFALDLVELLQTNRKGLSEEQIHSALLTFQTRDY